MSEKNRFDLYHNFTVQRELDALAAECLFGWRWRVKPAPVGGSFQTMLIPPQSTELMACWPLSDHRAPRAEDWDRCTMRFLPDFSTDVRAAFAVVAELARRGYWLHLHGPFEAGAGQQWSAGFTPHDMTGWNGRPDHQANAATAAQAICIAALVTVLPANERVARLQEIGLDA